MFSKMININTGLKDGVINDMAVINYRGLVGRTVDTSVGNTSYELGYIGIPTIHYTIEKREKIRAVQLERLKLGKFIKKDMSIIINELNKLLEVAEGNQDNLKNIIKIIVTKIKL